MSAKAEAGINSSLDETINCRWKDLRSLIFRIERTRQNLMNDLPSGMENIRDKLDENLKTCLADVYKSLESCSNLVNEVSDFPEEQL